MMLCKLSLSNIKKSFKDYAIYFVTLILGVCIFYIFNSIDSQTAMLVISSRKGEIISLLTELLSYVSVFVSFILGFLIIYASRFLIKKRNKEFAIYMTLGMSKRKIAFLILIETFLIGLISLVVGLLLGIVLSQVTSIFVANMFEADMTKFAFNFSKSAMIKTIIYYAIIYAIVMIFNTIIVNKNKLINLLQASKKQEKIKIKNSIICIILFILSIIMLGIAYYMVTDGLANLTSHDISILLVPISLGIIGTIIFFYSVAGMTLKVLSKCHNSYCKNLNTFVYKQINSKINTMVVSISVICIMLFLTLCLLSSALTIKEFYNNSINKFAPADFQLELYKESEKEIIDVKELFEEEDILKEIKDLVVVEKYIDEKFDLKSSYGSYYEEVKKQYPFVRYDRNVEIMKESDYNELANLFGFKHIELKENEYAIVSNYETEIYDEVMNRKEKMTVYGEELIPYGNKTIDGFIEMGGNPSNMGFIVVKDNVVKTNAPYSKIYTANYITSDKEQQEILNDKIYESNYGVSIMFNSKMDISEESVGLSAIVTFIGLYLGIIFLISSSAVLALKELSDCLDDKNKYKILRQIGAEENEINKALFKQTLMFFIMPLSLAIVHTIFGLRFCKFILSSLGISSILDGLMMAFIFLIGIYGIYFIITYLCSKNIIKEKI